jgi:dTDP-4-amino-4,6-dideoxygalactose transaminase
MWVPKKTINENKVSELIKKSIIANQFTNGGPNVKLLEEIVKKTLDIDKSVVCVSNGTVALWAVVACFELYHSKSLQFSTQSFTFPSSAQGPLENVHIVDIDKNGGMDLDKIPPCDGIIVTNVFGNVVDIEKYETWCKKNNKFLIFDNAATSYTTYKGKNSCNYGNASTISFHHTKPIGFGEGGCIIIDAIYEKTLRTILNFGIDNQSDFPKWNSKGGNYKMSDIQAIYIIQYLDHFQRIKSHSQSLYHYFRKKTNLSMYPNFSDDIPFVSCICFFSENSNEIIKKLTEQNIFSRKYYYPLIKTPIAIHFFNRIICIPCTIDMTITDIDFIIQIINENM